MTKHNANRIGARMADGSIFAGLTDDRKQQIYAMPNDLSVCMTFNDAAKAVNQLNTDRFLGHDDWQIPSEDNLRVLQKNQNKGELKDTFNTSGNQASDSGSPGWYWASTEGREGSSYVPGVRLSDGVGDWDHEDGNCFSCRPVRLVDSKRF